MSNFRFAHALSLRVCRVDNFFLSNMFTEETGVFNNRIFNIMKLISRYFNLLNLFFFLLVNFLLSLSAFIVDMVNQLISWL